MLHKTRQRMLTSALVTGLCCCIGATGWGMYQDQARAGQAVGQPSTMPVAQLLAPAKPTLSAERAWAMVGPQIDQSPWLSRADETSAWIDGAGQDAQDAAAAVSANLRELSVLMNEHWAGKRVTSALKMMADGTAALSPEPTLRALAIGVSYSVDHADQWAVMLADRADALGQWVESFTEPYERYAAAYAAVSERPTAERAHAWIQASQALLPHLAQAEKLCAALETQLVNVSERLSSIHSALEGADHWSVDWLASRIDGQMIVPSVEKLDQFAAQARAIRARASYDHGLIASLPGRFSRFEIVD